MINPSQHKEHIHPLIPSQLPEFVRVDHPTLVAFLSAYYEWLDTQTDYLRSPMKLGSVIDIDKTLDQFVDAFKNEYLLNFPKTLAVSKDTNAPVDDRKLIKNIKAFYAAKGTEKTYEFLFRILYDTNVEFYYPKRDILRLSDGKWIAKRSIKTSALQGNSIFGAAGKNVIQRNGSGNVIASARVVDVTTYQVGSNNVAEFSLSGINGQFVSGNYGIEFTDANGVKRNELRVFSVVSSVNITNAGTNYKVGDSVVFTPAAGDTGLNASGTVQEVDVNTGAIKRIRIDNFGVNYNIAPSVTVQSFDGSGFVGTTTIGALAQYAGYYANNDSRLSTNKVLQDNHYYQNYSYVLLTEVTIDRYRDVLRRLLHPAGMGFFGSVLLKRCNYANIDKESSLIRYEVPLIGNYAPYTNNTYDDLSVWFGTTAGDIAGYVPRVHDSLITGATGNPISFGIQYIKDTTEGGITGWGWNPSGLPISRITSNQNKKISVGYYSILALSATGTVSNSMYSHSSQYTSWVAGLTSVKEIGAGLYYSAAILNDSSLTAGGTIWNATTTSPIPLYFSTSSTPVPVGTGFKSVDVGMAGAIGVKSDGTLQYWGITQGSYQTGTNLLIKTFSLTSSAWSATIGASGGSVSVTGSSVTGPYHLAGFSTGLGLTAFQIDYTTGLTTAAGQTATPYNNFAFWKIENNEGKPVNILPQGVSSYYISSVYVKAAPGYSGATIGLRGVNAAGYSKLTLNENWQRLQTPPQLSYPSRPTSGNTTVFNLGIGNDPANGTTACSVYVWGPQLEGPLTSGGTATSYVRVEDHGVTNAAAGIAWSVSQIPQGVTFESVSLGRGKACHAVGLMADGGITAWGDKSYNQCRVPSDKNYKQVSASRICTLALTKDGGITGWGSNSYGQLTVPSGKNFISVDAGYHAACAIDVDGNSWFWGRSYQGPPANPNLFGSPQFAIPGATGVTAFDGAYIYNQVYPGMYPPSKYKFKQLQSGTYVSAGLFDAQELRSSGLGLSAAEPFWIVYQHPNRKITGKVVASIPQNLKSDFLGTTGVYWPEWAEGVTSIRSDWESSFTQDVDSKYAVLKYTNASEFRKITARSFFNLQVGKEFNCKYDTADSIPKPYLQIVSLNGKTPNSSGIPYDLTFANGNSPVVGGSNLTIITSIVNPDSIPYYGAASLWCDLYWVSQDSVTSYLIHTRGPLTTTTSTILLSPTFKSLLSRGMFSNYPGNTGVFTLSNGTQITANGKYRLSLYFKDENDNKVTDTETTTEFIYQFS